MKQLYILLLFTVLFPLTAVSQTEKQQDIAATETEIPAATETGSTLSTTKDSLSVPLSSPIPQPGFIAPFGMYGITPFDYGYATWQLHKGLNASIGLNLTFSPSRYAPSGVGFGQDATFMYAIPVTDRLSVAGGLYASNMDWGFLRYHTVGIAGVAAYKLTDRISIYAYGNKSFTPKRSPYYYPLPNYAPDRIGGMINFKVGESSSFSIGIEGRKMIIPGGTDKLCQ